MRPWVMGASALRSRLIDQFGWVEMVDKEVDRTGDKHSVGTRLKALLINIGTDRKALYNYRSATASLSLYGESAQRNDASPLKQQADDHGKKEKGTEPLILPGKQKSFRPTGVSVLEMLDEMTTVWVGSGDSLQRLTARAHDSQIERILGWFGWDLNIYSECKTACAEQTRQHAGRFHFRSSFSEIAFSFSRTVPFLCACGRLSSRDCSFQLTTPI